MLGRVDADLGAAPDDLQVQPVSAVIDRHPQRARAFRPHRVEDEPVGAGLGLKALRERLGEDVVMAVISEAPQNDPRDVQALYLGDAKRNKLLNEFLIPANS